MQRLKKRMNSPFLRYERQMNLKPIHQTGQQKIANARIAVVGCGALGTAVSNNLVRAGIGYLRIIDGDIVELSNLHRQQIFSEEDAKIRCFKVIAAQRFLTSANSQVHIEVIPEFLSASNALRLLADVDVIVDATDRFAVRFLLNDVALELRIPWVHGGALGFEGRIILFKPQGSCFRCIMRDMPKSDLLLSAKDVGIFGPLTTIIGSLQATEVIKYVLAPQSYHTQLLCVDIWNHEYRIIKIKQTANCPACQKGQRDFLNITP